MKNLLKKQIREIKLQIQILEIKLAILLLKKKLTIPNLPDPRFIFVHHGGGTWNFQQVDNHHKNKWGFISSLGFGCGYQYFIEYSGKVYKARCDNEEGAHTVGNTPHYYNKHSIGICLQGNCEITPPTRAQLKSLKKLLDNKKGAYNIPNDRVLGHREVFATLCPGKYLWDWLNIYRA